MPFVVGEEKKNVLTKFLRDASNVSDFDVIKVLVRVGHSSARVMLGINLKKNVVILNFKHYFCSPLRKRN